MGLGVLPCPSRGAEGTVLTGLRVSGTEYLRAVLFHSFRLRINELFSPRGLAGSADGTIELKML